MFSPEWILFLMRAFQRKTWARFGTLLRILKVSKVAKMARLAKVPHFLQTLESAVSSEYRMAYAKLLRQVFFIVVLNHVIGCGWFGTSKWSGDSGWAHTMLEEDRATYDMYLESMHWAISMLQGDTMVSPRNTVERTYAVVVLLVGLVVVSCFISSITTAMMTILSISSSREQSRIRLLRYLYENNVSSELSNRVRQFAREAALTRSTPDSEVELLKVLPESLRLELQYEIKGRVFKLRPFLQVMVEKDDELGKRLAHKMDQNWMHYGEKLFSLRQNCTCMYILRKGRLLYARPDRAHHRDSREIGHWRRMVTTTAAWMDGKRRSFSNNPEKVSVVEAGEAVCEMALWTTWWHRGHCTCGSACDVFIIEREALREVIVEFPREKNDYLLLYARRYVQWLNQDRATVDDTTDLHNGRSTIHLGSRSGGSRDVPSSPL